MISLPKTKLASYPILNKQKKMITMEINNLTSTLISAININDQLVNFHADYDENEHDILITDKHHNQFRLRVNDHAKFPVNRLEYLIFENEAVASTVELTNNNQLGDYVNYQRLKSPACNSRTETVQKCKRTKYSFHSGYVQSRIQFSIRVVDCTRD